MSIPKTLEMTRNDNSFETTMREVLRARKSTAASKNEDANVEYSSLVSDISSKSVDEIDHLIEGLQGIREKLNGDGDRLHREIVQHAAFSQSIIQLTRIISDGMAVVNSSTAAAQEPRDVTKRQPE